MSKSFIVLGGSGFLGKKIIEYLVKAGYGNIASGSRKITDYKNVENLKTDILEYRSLEKTCRNYNTIINCTGQITNPITECFKLNTTGIDNLSLLSNRFGKKIVQISTVSVYGSRKYADELSSLNPETPYSACKCFAEYHLTKSVIKKSVLTIRCSNIYGLGTKGIFGYLKRSYQTGRKLYFNNNGNLLRYYIHVDDCARLIVDLIGQKDRYGIHNLIGREKLNVRSLIKLVEVYSGVKFEVEYEQREPYENIEFLSDRKIRKIIKINYFHSIRNYLKENFKKYDNIDHSDS